MAKRFKNHYKINKRSLPVVELIWWDHCGSHGWQNYNQREGDGELIVAHTVGYLLDETNDTYVLAQTHAQTRNNQWNGTMILAKELVLKKKILSKKG